MFSSCHMTVSAHMVGVGATIWRTLRGETMHILMRVQCDNKFTLRFSQLLNVRLVFPL
jgi:hypothetical protein